MVYDTALLEAGGAGGSGASSAGGLGGDLGSGGQAGSSAGGGNSGGSGGAVAGNGGSVAGSGASDDGLAGAAGAAGTGAVTPLDLELIDDMEDGDTFVLLGTGRDGEWHASWDAMNPGAIDPHDPFVMLALDASDRPGSGYAAHARATGFNGSGWGSTMTVDMRQYQTAPYDASAYCGIDFWAKRSDDSYPAVNLRIADKNSMPAGGRCNDAVTTERCYNHFAAPVSLTASWKEYQIMFGDMLQAAWGYQAPTGMLEVSEIYMIEVGLPSVPTVEVYVDDLAFIKKPVGGSCADL